MKAATVKTEQFRMWSEGNAQTYPNGVIQTLIMNDNIVIL